MKTVPVYAGLDAHQAEDVPVVLTRLARHAMTGVSLLALGLAMAAVLPTGAARAQDTRAVVNGGGGGGVILLDSGAATALNAGGYSDAVDGILASGGYNAGDVGMTKIITDGVIQGSTGEYVVSNKIFSNFVTEGGAGSGGGGGLGGVFFVDQGASLVVNNVDFTRNAAIGGTGGSAPAVNLGAVEIGLGDIDMPFVPISAYYFDPTLLPDGSGGYTVDTLKLTAVNKGLQPGMRITLPGTTTAVTITEVSGKTVKFDAVTVAPSLLVAARNDLIRDPGQSDLTKLRFNPIEGALDLGDAPVKSILMIDGAQTNIRIESFSGSEITLSRALTPAEWDAITDDSDPANPTPVKFLNLTKADISQIKGVDTTGADPVIVLPGNNGFFKPGMVLTGGEFGSTSVKVIAVQHVTVGGAVETRIVVENNSPTDLTPFPSDLNSFNVTLEQVEAGGDTLLVTNSRLSLGMKVSGPGVQPGTTIAGIDDEAGTVTLSLPLVGDVKPELLTFTGVAGVSGSTVTFVNAALLAGVSEGMLVSGAGIPPGTTVGPISDGATTVTLVLPTGTTLGEVTALTFAAATSIGGSMNNLDQSVTGTTGHNGNNGWWSDPFRGNGEGENGFSGDGGGNGAAGAGGTGGTGGNGSSALQWNPGQIWVIADTAADAALNTAAAAAALATVPPDVAESVVATLAAAKDYVNLGFAISDLSVWYVKFAAGNNALGGNGAAGGVGGNGDNFFGGGVGGAGGNGGDAGNTANGHGGDGGAGGKGGEGGFGGGGGMGGAGGLHGEGVSTANGNGGAAGEGGFGGGDGTDGDGYGGDGGAGFGGAIFVRSDGSLTITGNSLFEDNGAQGGAAGEGGEGGPAAGADLFMMKGSHVAIRPGATAGVDNVVTFNGTIGDDSRASYVGAQYGQGFGADLTIGKGLTIFNGRNTYSGQTIMEGGVLQANDGWGLNTYSNLNFNGGGRTGNLTDNTNAGVLLSSGLFNRELGTIGQDVQWTGSGGFAGLGDDLIVNIGNLENPKTLVWGQTPGFFTPSPGLNAAALVFGSEHADSVVRWLNPINLNGADRQIVVTDNGNLEQDDFAVMEGAISGAGGLIVGEGGPGSSFWNGTLILTGDNTFTGDIALRSGTLAIAGDGTLTPGTDVNIAAGAEFDVMAEGLELGLVTNKGTMMVGEDLKALGIDNTGSVLMMADINLSPGFPYADDPIAYPEPNFYGDFFNHGPGGLLWVATGPDSTDSAHTLTVDRFYGDGDVLLGGLVAGGDAPILTIAQRGESTFDGAIFGAGGLTLTSSTDPSDLTPPVPASKLTLTNTNTYLGPTVIDAGSTLALAGLGSITVSESVQVDGTFDISAVTTTAEVGTAGPQGTKINDLSGAASGEIVLGDKLLVIDNAASLYAGIIAGAGDVAINDGVQTLSGINTYTGETYVLEDATLKLAASDPADGLSPDGSIADSVRVVVEGAFDISQTINGASIKGLEGVLSTAKVTLGDERLTITDANAFDAISPEVSEPVGSSFAGVISGAGGVSVTGGRQTLTNANDYTGSTIVGPDGELYLVDNGGVAASEVVTVDGIFDISGTGTIADTDAGAEIIRLGGTDADAKIRFGSQTLTLTGSGDSAFAGVITGDAASGLTIEDGTLTLTGASPGFLGKTTIEADASLFLVGAGGITGSTVALSGLFDISDVTAPGTSIADLYGDGEIDLGTKTLTVSDATGGIFSGPITGTGAFGVSGGGLNIDLTGEPDVNANIFAATGGKIALTGGTIDTTGSNQPALSVINGGVINVTQTRLITGATQPTAFVSFDDNFDNTDVSSLDQLDGNPAYVKLGAGTALQNAGPLLVVDRDNTGSTGNAFEGNVELLIDNASVVVGDILDEDAIRAPGMGSTEVYLGNGVSWTGKAVVGDFLVDGGASAHFNSGSMLDNLYAMTGAQVDLSGNVVILGRFTLDANGIVAPGSSPGTYNSVGTLESNGGNETLWIKFGQPDPQPGEFKDYSQINVGGDFTGLAGVGPGELAITLERWDSTQSTPLGNIADIELLKIGGTENPNSSVYLAERFTQNGHELQLDRRVRDVDPTAPVAGTEVLDISMQTEDGYFADDSLVVYGLKSIVQDETYGLATLTGTLQQAGRDALGTFVERRGLGELESNWMRVGGNHTEVGDTVANVQDLGFAQFGVDLIDMGGLRAGVLGSYTGSFSGVETETGTAGLQGNLWAGGVYGTWMSGGSYVDAVGEYGFSDWTFSPTSASDLTINGHTALASLEAGFKLGNDQISVTPWSQMVWQSTLYEGLDSDWVANADFVDNSSLYLRGGVRAEGQIGIFAPYLDLNLAYDVNERKTTTVDGFDFATGMGGTRVELGAGFQADISDTTMIWSQFEGAYGISEGTDVIGYQGQVGVSATW